MAKGSIKVGDEVVVTATVRKRVTEDRVSVLIPSYHQPHSIVVHRTPNISSGQKIELVGEVTRVDDDTVTVGGKDLGITVKRSAVRLIISHAAPKRKTPTDKKARRQCTSDGPNLAIVTTVERLSFDGTT